MAFSDHWSSSQNTNIIRNKNKNKRSAEIEMENCSTSNSSSSSGSDNRLSASHGGAVAVPLAIAVATILAVWITASGTVQGAALYSNVDWLSKPQFEQLCAAQQEHFIESDGKESSLILEFVPPATVEKRKSCTRILSAPPHYGFIVRLILPKFRRGQYNGGTPASGSNGTHTSSVTRLHEMSSLFEQLNATTSKTNLGRSCPLSIFSSLDPHTPQWRVDPCRIEDTSPEMEDPVHLFHGRIRIIWEHSNFALKSKLMVTVLGKGNQCRGENKHQCLKIGDEPILCISKDLVCDGIRHCPSSNEYDSDEDYAMCWKRGHFDDAVPPVPPMESDIFEHFALEVFRNLFAFDVSTEAEEPNSAVTSSTAAIATIAKTSSTQQQGPHATERTVTNQTASNTTLVGSTEHSNEAGNHQRRNSTRFGVSSDLSKYGPWGYLMLGMLLCGGALLICGLWVSASQHAVNNEREVTLQHSGGGISIDHASGTTSPPNYEELDPPPAYSVLFPNQKAASSSTVNIVSDTIGGPVTSQPLPPSIHASALADAAAVSEVAAVHVAGASQSNPACQASSSRQAQQ